MPERLHEKIMSWCPPHMMEPQALNQLYNTAKLPFVTPHVAVMPDCHFGAGSTVGSVIPTEGAIIPAAVGVDIGCGMVAISTPYTSKVLPDNLEQLRLGIERRIPLGAGGHNKSLSVSAARRCQQLEQMRGHEVRTGWPEQLGSLGSGNHFIEICLDETDHVWAVLHSGSRGIGYKLAQQHIATAKRLVADEGIVLSDKDLAFLWEHTPDFDAYIRDLQWAQAFARANRDEMIERVLMELSAVLHNDYRLWRSIEVKRINCHHNFTQQEEYDGRKLWITRKGAIEMRPGMQGVIPGSMGTCSYIVSGLGNVASFNSAPHGAGRRFSRAEAKRRFTMDDFDLAMDGIECRRAPALIDELPGAYKNINEVMLASDDLVQIDHELRQILNVKGD